MKTDIQAESMWLRKDKYVEANHTKPEANEIRAKSELGESSLHTTQRTRQPTHYNLLKGFELLLKIEENISSLKKKKKIQCISSTEWTLNPSEKVELSHS